MKVYFKNACPVIYCVIFIFIISTGLSGCTPFVAAIGAAHESYCPLAPGHEIYLTDADRRRIYPEFSFSPPQGEKWLTMEPVKRQRSYDKFGQSTVQTISFAKVLWDEKNYKSMGNEALAFVEIVEFEDKDFNSEKDLIDFINSSFNWENIQNAPMEFSDVEAPGLCVQYNNPYTPMSYSSENAFGAMCVKFKNKVEKDPGTSIIGDTYISNNSGYACRNPKRSNQIIYFQTIQINIKGIPIISVQSELDSFLNSLKFN